MSRFRTVRYSGRPDSSLSRAAEQYAEGPGFESWFPVPCQPCDTYMYMDTLYLLVIRLVLDNTNIHNQWQQERLYILRTMTLQSTAYNYMCMSDNVLGNNITG
jgi:hypothetical protein